MISLITDSLSNCTTGDLCAKTVHKQGSELTGNTIAVSTVYVMNDHEPLTCVPGGGQNGVFEG